MVMRNPRYPTGPTSRMCPTGKYYDSRTQMCMERTPAAPPRMSEVEMRRGGKAESKAMMKKEVSFMKKKGAPKSMIRHEEAEYGMKKGMKRMAGGGYAGTTMPGSPPPTGPTKPVGCPPGYMNVNGNCVAIDDFNQPPPIEPEEFERRIRGTREGMMGGRSMAGGGTAKSGGSYRRAADGIASKGKTKGHVVKMAGGGMASSYRRAADGIATKGKTKGKQVRMYGGGMCK